MGFDMGRVDHLDIPRSTTPCEVTEKPFPDATLRPANEAIIDRGVRTIFRRAIAPSATALDDVNNAADHTTIIYTLLATDILRQVRLDLPPLFIAQPK
jgi:hypothetical protein